MKDLTIPPALSGIPKTIVCLRKSAAAGPVIAGSIETTCGCCGEAVLLSPATNELREQGDSLLCTECAGFNDRQTWGPRPFPVSALSAAQQAEIAGHLRKCN